MGKICETSEFSLEYIVAALSKYPDIMISISNGKYIELSDNYRLSLHSQIFHNTVADYDEFVLCLPNQKWNHDERYHLSKLEKTLRKAKTLCNFK